MRGSGLKPFNILEWQKWRVRTEQVSVCKSWNVVISNSFEHSINVQPHEALSNLEVKITIKDQSDLDWMVEPASSITSQNLVSVQEIKRSKKIRTKRGDSEYLKFYWSVCSCSFLIRWSLLFSLKHITCSNLHLSGQYNI